MRKAKVVALFFLVVFSTLLFAYDVGEVASCVKLNDLQVDRTITYHCLDSKNDGNKYVLVEFMSVTCGPCIENLPAMDLLNKKLSDRLTVRVASIDRNLDLVNAFLADPKNSQYISFPFSYDNNREAAKVYNIMYTPTMFILNESNQVVYKHIGILFDADIQEISELVAQ